MPATLALDPSTGDLDFRTGGLRVLSGPAATAQNVAVSFLTERGAWGLNPVRVGFPLAQVLLVAAYSGGGDAGLARASSLASDHLRTSDGTSGVTGVLRVLRLEPLAVDDGTMFVDATVQDVTGAVLSVAEEVEVAGV